MNPLIANYLDKNDWTSTECVIQPQQPQHSTSNSTGSTVTIDLTDCFACSGCLTTSETILLQTQSVDLFLEKYKTCSCIAFSISTTSLVSIYFWLKQRIPSITPERTLQLISKTLKTEFGVNYVFDLGEIRDLSLYLTCQEFINRLPSTFDPSISNKTLPMLVSACPGFVISIEKQNPELIPLLSKTKTPMLLLGSLLKHRLKEYKTHTDVYHVSIQPCYDKKMEAHSSNDVDLCLTTSELLSLLGDFDIWKQIQSTNPDPSKSESLTDTSLYLCWDSFLELTPPNADRQPPQISMSYGSSAGGWIEFIHNYLFSLSLSHSLSKSQPNKNTASIEAKHTPSQENPSFDIVSHPNFIYQPQIRKSMTFSKKSKDLGKLDFVVPENSTLFSINKFQFFQAYSFKHVQNMVRKVQGNKTKYHLIEMFACPSACVNGGGQIPIQAPHTVADLEEEYINLSNARNMNPFNNPLIKKYQNDWVHQYPMDLWTTTFSVNPLKDNRSLDW